MYSPTLYKYRDSFVLYIPTLHPFGSVLLSHTLLIQTHIHDVPPPATASIKKKDISFLHIVHAFACHFIENPQWGLISSKIVNQLSLMSTFYIKINNIFI